MNNLKLIVLDNIKKIGDDVNYKLQNLNNTKENYIINMSQSRFSNGEGKVTINDTVRDKDIYILSDVGNYGQAYKMHNFMHHMAPDEHFQDIKRTISALSGSAERITVIMPLLYQSRQDKRVGKESLDCAIALQELEHMGVNHIVTFDCHNPSVCNAVPNLPFENFYPTNTILMELLTKEDLEDIIVVGPDQGAAKRARYYANILGGCEVDTYVKTRDYSKVVNGKNPITEHKSMGINVKGKDVLIVDDMIASGSSMLEVGEDLKEKGAKQVFFITTFSLFTEGIDMFDKAYQDNAFDKLYTTNLTYIPEEYQQRKWLHTVDCSEKIAQIINCLHNKESLKNISNGKDKILALRYATYERRDKK